MVFPGDEFVSAARRKSAHAQTNRHNQRHSLLQTDGGSPQEGRRVCVRVTEEKERGTEKRDKGEKREGR